ncbi:MAG: hypothetical protein RJB55_2682, partial [Verrucomicrobiota bacterium]
VWNWRERKMPLSVYPVSNVFPVFPSFRGQKNTRPVAGAGGEGVAVG